MIAPWYLTRDELLAFATILTDAGEFPEAEDLLRFIEKPWKWTPEYEAWVRQGRPAKVEDPDLLRAP